MLTVSSSSSTDGGMAALPVALFRRRVVSLPFTDSCEPLFGASREPGALADELAALRVARRLASIEVRGDVPAKAGHRVPAGYRHELALQDDYAATAAGFSKSKVGRKLRRADREGVAVRRTTTTRSLLEDFYPLHVATRRRLGVPVQPRRFFTELGERMIETGLGFTLVAEVGGEVTCSAVFLIWNGRMIYKFSASERSHGDVGASQASFERPSAGVARTAAPRSISAAPTPRRRVFARSSGPGEPRSMS